MVLSTAAAWEPTGADTQPVLGKRWPNGGTSPDPRRTRPLHRLGAGGTDAVLPPDPSVTCKLLKGKDRVSRTLVSHAAPVQAVVHRWYSINTC